MTDQPPMESAGGPAGPSDETQPLSFDRPLDEGTSPVEAPLGSSTERPAPPYGPPAPAYGPPGVPITGGGMPSVLPPALPPGPTYGPPSQRPSPFAAPGPGPSQPPTWIPPGTQPLPAAPSPARHAASRGRVTGWLWPSVAAVALVVGVLGGIGGAAIYDRADDGPVPNGLGGVDTVSEAPLTAADDGSVAKVAQELLPSTVQIVAYFDGEEAGATGSGFVLDRQGHFITNNHVVADAAENDGPIEIVDQDGNRYDAKVVGRSKVYDLAVLSVPDATDLKPASLGASRKLRVGEGVVAIGSPLGLSSTVTAGIVSALDRPVTTGDASSSSYIDAVQTDAAINPGNSGGPLVNLLGQVVGVNSAIATTGGSTTGEQSGNIGVGFAIPIEQVKITADQILRTGEARYPIIGAQVQTGDQNAGDGATIDKVVSGTPADDAGLLKGDLVTAVDGEKVTNGIALIVSIRTHQPGDQVRFTFLRNGEERDVELTLDSEVG